MIEKQKKMSNKDQHSSQSDDFLKQVEIPFQKSKEVVWADLSAKLADTPTTKQPAKVIAMSFGKIAAAATVALLLGLGLFSKLHTNTIICERGKQLEHKLPDGSSVELNAESSLTYHPYWWTIKREINFEGEGFFEVEKGSNFTVISNKGTTQVLGTSFNISTRNNNYAVFCKTGKVRVSSNDSDEKTILTPDMLAEIKDNIKVTTSKDAKAILSWKDDRFHFEAKPLPQVFEEIERQYDITIQQQLSNSAVSYTGYFNKPDKADIALNLICQSFGFTFVKLDEHTFRISQK